LLRMDRRYVAAAEEAIRLGLERRTSAFAEQRTCASDRARGMETGIYGATLRWARIGVIMVVCSWHDALGADQLPREIVGNWCLAMEWMLPETYAYRRCKVDPARDQRRVLVVKLHAQRSVHRLPDFGNRGGRLVADLVGVDDRHPRHQDGRAVLALLGPGDELVAPAHDLADVRKAEELELADDLLDRAAIRACATGLWCRQLVSAVLGRSPRPAILQLRTR
jgi:hypothetical protein